jgi:formate dehydrogenase subunit delta
MSGGTEHIVQMANDIGNFFRAEPDRTVAMAGISNHINRFWTRRMRQKLLEYAQQGGAGLDELPRAALAQVNVGPAGQPPAAPAASRA